MVRAFNADDKGKKVMTNDGDSVGTVQEVEEDTAHVQPDSDLSTSIRQRLGWAKDDKEMFALDNSHVRSFTDDEVYLKD
ncbi:hypothetical protein HALDL1_10735 [Halobacterium sp. DL1]|jgi:sporulation protein YlmC with PRC-barrel domain|nr:hypothetical protein HALDL1_10735 [Halobacterium sp. DL1]